jgi:glycosyltransferase involved in cell wall biosynthesis
LATLRKQHTTGIPRRDEKLMRVLHFYKTYYPDSFGGVEQVIFQLAEGGIRHGVEAEVLYLSTSGAAHDQPVGHHITHRSRLDFQFASTSFSWSAFQDFSRLAQNVDLIHYHFPWPFMDVVHFATRPNKPAVVSYHSDIIKQKHLLRLYQPLMHRFLSGVDRIVSASPNYLQSSSVLKRHIDKVRVIPYGLDKSTYAQLDARRLATWRERVGERFFLFLGMLRYYKGLHILLDAIKDAPYPVVIAGAGPIEQELKEHAQRLGLRNLHFVGQVSEEDKAALFNLCYAVTFPSHLRSEAFGISLLEGAMYGKPLISSEIGTGTTYINIDGETGLVVPPSDPLALRHAMKTLWDNPNLASQMGQRAQQRYEQLFTSERMTQSYVELYRSVIDDRSRSSC